VNKFVPQILIEFARLCTSVEKNGYKILVD